MVMKNAENLGTLAGMALLAATAAFILYHAITKIFVRPIAPSFAVLIISIGVDLSSARALRKAAKKQYSDALASDAEHFWNDLLGAMAVLAGLAIVAVSRAYHRPIHSNVIPNPSVCSYDTRTARVLIASRNEVGNRHEREQGKNFHCFARSVIFSVRDT
jgi:Cation efflux family